MNCPHCGAAVPSGAGAGRCSVCDKAVHPGRQVAAGVLTPTPSRDAENTVLPGLTGGLTRLYDPPTGVIPPSIGPDAPTGFNSPVGAGVDGGPVTPGSGAASGTGSKGPLVVGQSFGPRYHIIRELGVGGMGAVYQAWDSELGVSVAIKVIRPEIMADPGTGAEVERRFRRELLLARQVTHKNVVRIHDLGEIDGIKYITMSYVDGTDLATLLKRQGQLPVKRVLHIARPIVSGLIAAHAADVVHRDLKPANIMIVAEDDALIMDFGIARSTSGGGAKPSPDVAALPAHLRRSAVRRSDATLLGAVVGTVEYMAPEQAKGQDVDQRADIYALGLILYDMLVGRRRAEQAPTAINELQLRMQQAPPPVKSIVPEVPDALDGLISRCLDPDPAKRYQTTVELEAELNRLDENGELIPIPARFSTRMIAGAVTLVLALVTATWYFTRPPPPPRQHDPVSVVIADLRNNTGDPAFDHVLEPTLKRVLEGASFISAYDRSGIARTIGVRPPETLDEVGARQLAVREGLNVILSGALDRQGNGYGVSIKAAQTVTGNVIADVKGNASNKDQVLGVATKLVNAVRDALGDETSDSARQFAMTTLSTTSLEVVRHHAAAMEASSNNKFPEALESFKKAVDLDPKFGIGYQGMAAMSMNLGKRQDAEKYLGEALKHVDGMTEREKYQTRGLLFFFSGDYKTCVKEFGDQLVRYPASPDAHTLLALCLTYLREMPKAVDEMRRAVGILPKQVLYRTNLALFASYASDFQTAEQEARAIQNPKFSAQALAFAQLGQGQVSQTIETYEKLAAIDAMGASLAASGLGDLALYEGRFSDAVRIFEKGAAADLSSKNPDRAAAKFASLAYAHVSRGQRGPAVAAAIRALDNSKDVKIRFLAARTYVEAGDVAKAKPLIAGLANELQAEPQAYAKILEGEIAVKDKDARQAIKLFGEANGLLDTWIGHFDLGRAYLEISQFTQADSEFDRCLKRRGEALALFIDEEPSFGYFPPVYYYQGRAREGMKTEGFAQAYRTYLNIRGKSSEDPFVREARRKAGG